MDPVAELVGIQSDRWNYVVMLVLGHEVDLMLTEHSTAISDWVQSASTESIVGIAIISQPENASEVFALCAGTSVLVVRLGANRLHFPENFYQFLANRARTFIGSDLGQTNLQSLQLANPRLVMHNVRNVRQIILNGMTLDQQNIDLITLGFLPVVDPAVEVSDWSQHLLTSSQLYFVALRSYVNGYLGAQNRDSIDRQAGWDILAGGPEAFVAAATVYAQANAILEFVATGNHL